ncbi:MAG: ATP-binding protein [Cyanobacteria bacterium P01_G01_bin.67]
MSASNIAIKQTLGDFIHNLPSCQEYLILSFSPGSMPLRQRWRNNCLSADFLADYLSTFFLGNNDQQPDTAKQVEVKSAVSYIANELLENGMKYCVEASLFPISIQIHLNPKFIVFQLTNSITVKQTRHFQYQIKKLLNGDPGEMYLAQLEKNALEENHASSNLGLLTMLHDYGAKLGWKFESLPTQSTEMAVTTMVQLAI